MSQSPALKQQFGLAFQFMTRLPAPWPVAYSEQAQQASARYYPAVGLVVGGIAALVLALASMIVPPAVAALLAVGAAIAVTGGLHEDGLADTADGLGSGAPRARALEIMRDSSVGVFGAIALVLVIALKASALAALPLGVACVGLIAAHAVSRFACVYIIRRHHYARITGAKFAAPSVDASGDRVALLWALAILVLAWILIGFGAVIALTVAALLVWLLMRAAVARLEGYTGDILGAAQQIAEVGFYLGLLAWL